MNTTQQYDFIIHQKNNCKTINDIFIFYDDYYIQYPFYSMLIYLKRTIFYMLELLQ